MHPFMGQFVRQHREAFGRGQPLGNKNLAFERSPFGAHRQVFVPEPDAALANQVFQPRQQLVGIAVNTCKFGKLLSLGLADIEHMDHFEAAYDRVGLLTRVVVFLLLAVGQRRQDPIPFSPLRTCRPISNQRRKPATKLASGIWKAISMQLCHE